MPANATTAILVIDLQNDTIHPDGAFASTGAAEHAASQNLIPNVRRIVDAAHAASAPVIFNRIVVYPGAAGGTNAPIFRMLGPESFKLGSWGAEIVDDAVASALSYWLVNDVAVETTSASLAALLDEDTTLAARRAVAEWPNQADGRLRALAEPLVNHLSAKVRAAAIRVVGSD